jgi:hypothetical protein
MRTVYNQSFYFVQAITDDDNGVYDDNVVTLSDSVPTQVY